MHTNSVILTSGNRFTFSNSIESKNINIPTGEIEFADEYFKDVYCMTENGANKSATWYNKTDDIYLTRADASVAATWNLFLKKSNYENITDRTRKPRIENSYYYTYLGAKYRIDLLGTTLDGEKAVIASKTVDTPTQLDDFFKDYTVGTKAISTTLPKLPCLCG